MEVYGIHLTTILQEVLKMQNMSSKNYTFKINISQGPTS